jgi:hypothetical protein
LAYLRSEKEDLEISYSLESLWDAIPKVVKALQWSIEEKDDEAHRVKLKTKAGFMSYSSILYLEAKSVDDKTTRMAINAETPVTTITSMADFGRTRDRVEAFIIMLAKEMEKKKRS